MIRYKGLLVAGVALVLALALPLFLGEAYVQIGIDLFMLAVLASAWNLIGGLTGYPSFGNAFFFGTGAYVTGVLMTVYGISFGLSLTVAAVFCVAAAAVIGVPVLRLKGHYFALATLGLSEAMHRIVANMEVTGGGAGLVLPIFFNTNFFYYSMLGILVATVAFTYWLKGSRWGYAMMAIREDEAGARSMGINTTTYKVLAYASSGLFTGLAGGVFAYRMTFIDPSSAFETLLNVKMIVMAIFGGAGTVFGPTIGAVTIGLVSESLSTQLSSVANLLFGVVIVAAVIFFPEGLLGIGRRSNRRSWAKVLIDNVRAHRI